MIFYYLGLWESFHIFSSSMADFLKQIIDQLSLLFPQKEGRMEREEGK